MTDSLGPNGLELSDQQTLIDNTITRFEAAYGNDIDVTSTSPDAQIVQTIAQAGTDVRDITAETFTSMDPDQAVGTVLDQRISINGIQRQGGTYTVTPIEITTSGALNLYGLDQTTNPVYYVQDSTGNQWQLMETQNISGAGTYSFQFQAANPGQVSTIPNTINVPGSIVLGVTAINNPSTYTALGQNEEADVIVKIRRQQSTSIASQGFQSGIQAALGNVSGVTYSKVWENYGQTNPPTGVSLYTMWAVVSGTAQPADIAQAIYVNRSEGCNMKGSQSYAITQLDGSTFTVLWDYVVSEALYIGFTATSLDGINVPNLVAILTQLPGIFVPGIGQEVNINQLSTYVQQIDPNTLVTGAGFSTSPSGPWTNTLTPSALNNQFAVSATNTYIFPVVLLPLTVTIAELTTQQFNAYGGKPPYTYSVSGTGGGSINASTGLYTASNHPGVDTVHVVDSLATYANSTVTIT